MCDAKGHIFVWADESKPSPVKNVREKEKQSSIMLEICDPEQ